MQAGADAVYFGLQSFNARARATNFAESELADVMKYLHEHETKGFVALNTLAFDAELPAVEKAIRACAAAGVDAVIVQDFGVAMLCRAIAPELPLHASTQMTCTDAASVNWAKSLGAKRVVLARELSLKEIATIRAHTDVELEVFVHGALCISYSGQCLTSEALGGRSANRGACAQACRLPYELVVDGDLRRLPELAYLLSPQDLEASDLVPQLAALEISSFKIEGRLKGPEYVAANTRLYREAIDATFAGAPSPSERTREIALQSYTRGSGHGFFDGVDHQHLVEGKLCEHRGLQVGRALGIKLVRGRPCVQIGLKLPLARGDGLLIEGGRASQGEVGGRVWSISVNGRDVEQAAAHTDPLVWLGPDVDARQVRADRRVFRTDEPAAKKEIQASLNKPHSTALHLTVSGRLGGPLQLSGLSAKGISATVCSDLPLAKALQRPLGQALLREQLGRLGGSPYHLGALVCDLPADVVVPISSLNRARRALVEALAKSSARQWATFAASTQSVLAATPLLGSPPPAGLFLLCRTVEQARAALDAGADGVYLDFLELTGTGEALRALRSQGAAFVGVAPPRIRKPGEEKIDRFLLGLAPDALLVRGLGALTDLQQNKSQVARGAPLFVGDFSLNITNRLSAQLVLNSGLSAFTPSFDLDGQQLVALLSGRLAAFAEVVIHHPMPLFHMEHCVIAALLSSGRDHRSCGRPCDSHQISLRDRASMDHPVQADVGCRNTVFHAAAQSAAPLLPGLTKSGVKRFRVELVRQDEAEVKTLVRVYRDVIAGNVSATAARQSLKSSHGYGVVSGSLRVL